MPRTSGPKKGKMLGIEDTLVGLAYVLCIASMALCVAYAWLNWNRGDDSFAEEDEHWAKSEQQAEEEL